MKDFIKIVLVTFLMMAFSGCSKKADYEDKDLSKFFVEQNKEKLKKIYQIISVRYHDVWRAGDIDTLVYESFMDSILPSLELNAKYIKDCNYPLFIDSNSVEFLQDDILQYGKEYMYQKAQECLDSVVVRMAKDKSDKQIAEYKKEMSLNKKFDKNEVK